MKKFILVLTVLLGLSGVSAQAEAVFSHPIDAATAAKNVPAFESTSCSFTQQKFMKTSTATIQSGGNFKFLKDKGVIFETTYPIHSTASYIGGQNKIVNAVIKSISSKNYTYLEKNFDIFYVTNAQNWVLALKPKAQSELKGEMENIMIFGSTINSKGLINKIIIDTQSIKTTLQFTKCS